MWRSGGILGTHSRDSLPGLERSLAGVVMKFIALGVCLLCAFLVFRFVQNDTEKTEAAVSSSYLAEPKMRPQSASALGTALPAGTVVSVALVDPINSEHDPFGKQYVASVDVIDGHAIAPGSRATVVLLNNNTGWLAQLTTLTLNGQEFQVLSGAGSVIATKQDGKAGTPSPILGQLGLGSAAPASSQRVLLPPATRLRFVLMGTPTAARAVTVASRPYRTATSVAPVAGIRTKPSLPPAESIPAPRNVPEYAYLCRAIDTPDRPLPIGYYLADVIKTSDSQAVVERRWLEFLAAKYPYKFANNRHASAQCTRLIDPATEFNALKKIDVSGNAEIVQTRWHYTLGPPPSPASLPAASTLPTSGPQ
jgi:hypothetical protein